VSEQSTVIKKVLQFSIM